MIKTEVVFDEWKILLNGYEIQIHHDYDYVEFAIIKDCVEVERFIHNIELAIEYCLNGGNIK